MLITLAKTGNFSLKNDFFASAIETINPITMYAIIKLSIYI